MVQGWIEDYLDYLKKVNILKAEAILTAKGLGKDFCEESFIQTLDFQERWEMDFIREKIFKEIGKIINGIIFTHRFTVWENYDDLYQEAAEACLKALPKI